MPNNKLINVIKFLFLILISNTVFSYTFAAAPTSTFVSATADNIINISENTAGFTVIGKSSQASGKLYIVPAGSYANETGLNSAKIGNASVTVANTNINITISGSKTTNGTTYKVYAANSAHQISSASTGSFVAELIAPSLTKITEISTPTNNDTPSYTFHSTKAGTISYAGGCTSATTTTSVEDKTVTFSHLNDNTYSSCTIQVIDSVGNPSNILNITSFTVDTVAPTITITEPDNITHEQSKTITATKSDGTLKMKVLTVLTDACDGDSGYETYASKTFSAEADNGKAMCYRAVDTAGNVSWSKSTKAIGGIDTTAPNITINKNPDASKALSKTVAASIDNGTLEYKITTSTICNGTGFGSYAGELIFSAEADNNKYVCFKAYDNTIPTPNIRYLRSNQILGVDRTKPTLGQVTPVPDPTSNKSPNYTFSSTETGTITYGGACASSTTSASVGENIITFNELGNGTYSTCKLYVTDAATNQSDWLTVNTFTIDTQPPQINPVSITSSNTNNHSYAKTGDTVTVTFTSNKTLKQTPTVTIGGKNATVTPSGNNYSAVVTMLAGDSEGVLTFKISNIQDLAGNTVADVESTTNGSSVIYDKTAPIINITGPISGPAQNKTVSASKDIITDILEYKITTSSTCNGTIGTFNSYTGGLVFASESYNNKFICYKAYDYPHNITYKLSDEIKEIDTIKPTLPQVSISSNNTNSGALATTSNIITINLTGSEKLKKVSATIIGQSAQVTTGANQMNFQLRHTVQSSDTNGIVSFSINYEDLAGNVGDTVISTKDSSQVIVDTVVPYFTNIQNWRMQGGKYGFIMVGGSGWVNGNLVTNISLDYTMNDTGTKLKQYQIGLNGFSRNEILNETSKTITDTLIGISFLNENKNTILYKLRDAPGNLKEEVKYIYNDKTKPVFKSLSWTRKEGTNEQSLISVDSKSRINSYTTYLTVKFTGYDGLSQLSGYEIKINNVLYWTDSINGYTGHVNLDILANQFHEDKNTIQIRMRDNVANEEITSQDIYKDSVLPILLSSGIILKTGSNYVNFFDNYYFNTTHNDVYMTGALLETGSGLDTDTAYLSGQEVGNSSQMIFDVNSYLGATGTNQIFSHLFSNFKSIYDGKYNANIKIKDRVGNIASYRFKDFLKDAKEPSTDDFKYLSGQKKTIENSIYFSDIKVYSDSTYYTNKTKIKYSFKINNDPGKINTTPSNLSGIKLDKIYYYISGSNTGQIINTVKINSFISGLSGNIVTGDLEDLNLTGIYVFKYYLYDRAGNYGIYYAKFLIYDPTPVEILDVKINTGNNLSFNPNVAGYTGYYYMVGNGNTINLSFRLNDIGTTYKNVAGIQEIIVYTEATSKWGPYNASDWDQFDAKSIQSINITGDNVIEYVTFKSIGKLNGYSKEYNISNTNNIYRFRLKITDRAGNISEKILGGYFIKDTDVPTVMGITKEINNWTDKYGNGSRREDGWDITDPNDNRFNIQTIVYTENGEKKQKFRLYFTCQDTNGAVSVGKILPENPNSTIKWTLYDNYKNTTKLSGNNMSINKCNNGNIYLGEYSGYKLNTTYTFNVYLEDEIGNNGKGKTVTFSSVSYSREGGIGFMTMPDIPYIRLRDAECGPNCDTSKRKFVDQDGYLKPFEGVDINHDNKTDWYAFTTDKYNYRICFSGYNINNKPLMVGYGYWNGTAWVELTSSQSNEVLSVRADKSDCYAVPSPLRVSSDYNYDYLTSNFYQRKDFYVYFMSVTGRNATRDYGVDGYGPYLKSPRVYFTIFKNKGIFAARGDSNAFSNYTIGAKARNYRYDYNGPVFFGENTIENNTSEIGVLSNNITEKGNFELFLSGNNFLKTNNYLKKSTLEGTYTYTPEENTDKLSRLVLAGKIEAPNQLTNADSSTRPTTPQNMIYLANNKFNGLVNFALVTGYKYTEGINSGFKLSAIVTGTSTQRLFFQPYFNEKATLFNNSDIPEIEVNPYLTTGGDHKVSCAAYSNKSVPCFWYIALRDLPENYNGNINYNIIWRIFKNDNMDEYNTNGDGWFTKFVIDMTPPKLSIPEYMKNYQGMRDRWRVDMSDSNYYGWLSTPNIPNNFRFTLYDVTSNTKLCENENNNICREVQFGTRSDYQSYSGNINVSGYPWNGSWNNQGTFWFNVALTGMDSSHLYKLVYQVKDMADNWSNYSQTYDHSNLGVGNSIKYTNTSNQSDRKDYPQKSGHVSELSGYRVMSRREFQFPFFNKIIKYYLTGATYGRDDNGNHMVESSEINPVLKNVNEPKIEVYAMYDYIFGWVYYKYSGDYQSIEKHNNFLKLSNVNPVTNNGEVLLTLKIDKEEFSKYQYHIPTDNDNTGISRFYWWIVDKNKSARDEECEGNTYDDYCQIDEYPSNKSGCARADECINVVDRRKIFDAFINSGGQEYLVWGEECKDAQFTDLNVIKKRLVNRIPLKEAYTGSFMVQTGDKCEIVKPPEPDETTDNTMDCMPKFLMYERSGDIFIMTRVIAPKTADNKKPAYTTGNVSTGLRLGLIIPEYVSGGVELRKHTWGRPQSFAPDNGYMHDDLSSSIFLRYQTLWGPPGPPVYIGYKGFVYKKIDTGNGLQDCPKQNDGYGFYATCNMASRLLTGNTTNWFLDQKNKTYQIFYSKYVMTGDKYIRTRHKDIFSENPKERIAQVVCLRSNNQTGYLANDEFKKICFDLPGKALTGYQDDKRTHDDFGLGEGKFVYNQIWIDTDKDRKFNLASGDISLVAKYGAPEDFCLWNKYYSDNTLMERSLRNSKNIAGYFAWECDINVSLLVNKIPSSQAPSYEKIIIRGNSSWLSQSCADTYSSIPSMSTRATIFADFTPPSIAWFSIADYNMTINNQQVSFGYANVAKRNTGGSRFNVYFREQEWNDWGQYDDYNGPDSAYMNDWTGVTYARVYKLGDNEITGNLIYDTRKNNLFKYPYTHFNENWAWYIDNYIFTGEGKYKAKIDYADAPMYHNKVTEDKCFFLDKNPPQVLAQMPYHTYLNKDDPNDPNQIWLKVCNRPNKNNNNPCNKDGITNQINELRNTYYAPGIINGGPTVTGTIFQSEDRFLTQPWLLVKDVSLIDTNTSYMKFQRKANKAASNSTWSDINFTYNTNNRIKYYQTGMDDDPFDCDSQNERYVIVEPNFNYSSDQYGSDANQIRGNPGAYRIQYHICDLYQNCTDGYTQEWYYDPPNPKIDLDKFSVEYYDGPDYIGSYNLLPYLNNPTELSKWFRSDGRFLRVTSKAIKNNDINKDGNSIVPDNTLIRFVTNNSYGYFGLYDTGRNKLPNRTNIAGADNDYVRAIKSPNQSKSGIVDYLIKLPSNNEPVSSYSIIIYPWYSLTNEYYNNTLQLNANLNRIIASDTYSYKKILVDVATGTDITDADNRYIGAQPTKFYYRQPGDFKMHINGTSPQDGISFGSGWFVPGINIIDAGKYNGTFQFSPVYSVNSVLSGYTSNGPLSGAFDYKFVNIPYNINTSQPVADVLKYAAGQYNVSIISEYKAYDYDNDGNPDFVINNNYDPYDWIWVTLPVLSFTVSGDNNCQALGKMGHQGCTYFDIYGDKKKTQKNHLDDQKLKLIMSGGNYLFVNSTGDKISEYANTTDVYTIRLFLKDKYGNDLARWPEDTRTFIGKSKVHDLKAPYIQEENVSGAGPYCAGQKGNDDFKAITGINNIYKQYYYRNYISTAMPTPITGGQNKPAQIDYTLNTTLGFNYDFDEGNNNYWPNAYSKSDVLYTHTGLKLIYYAAISIYLQNFQDDTSLRFGQSLKYAAWFIPNGASSSISNISFYFKFSYLDKNNNFNNCLMVNPLVKLDSVNDDISKESQKLIYYKMDEAIENNKQLIKGSQGKNYLAVYSSSTGTNEDAAWQGDYSQQFSEKKDKLNGWMRNWYRGGRSLFSGSSWPYNKAGFTFDDIKADTKVYIDSRLNNMPDNKPLIFYFGGLVKRDVENNKCSNKSNIMDLQGKLDFVTNLVYTFYSREAEDKFQVKVTLNSSKNMFNKNVTEDNYKQNIEQTKGENDNNAISVTINPAKVQGLVGGKSSWSDIQSDSSKIKFSRDVFSFSNELGYIKKKIMKVLRGYSSKYCLDSLATGIVLSINNIENTAINNACLIKTVFDDEKYYVYDFSSRPLNDSYLRTVSFSGNGAMYYTNKNIYLIKGADVYIKNDLLKDDLVSNDGLLLVVLKDDQGRGGNIFIDPRVVNIDARMIAEGMILSAKDKNGDWKIDYEKEIYDENEQDFGDVSNTLKNQLFIYGGIHSRNTLGGANERSKENGYFEIPPVNYLMMSGISLTGTNIEKLRDYTDYRNLAESNYFKAFNIAKRFDLNFLRYYKCNLTGSNCIPVNTGSVLAGYKTFANNFEGTSNNPYRDPQNKFNAVVISNDNSYSQYKFWLDE